MAEAATEPGRQWIRLSLDARDASASALNSIVANLTQSVAISDPEQCCNIAISGAPARGWVEKLEQRNTMLGVELWAHVSWIDRDLAEACADGTLWCKTKVDRAALDPRSGLPIGRKLMAVELVPAPSPSTFEQKKEDRNHMTTASTTNANPNVSTVLAALPRFRDNAPNDTVALERAAREVLSNGKTMTREQLYEDVVHPALLALGAQKFRAASTRAGVTVRASSASSDAATSNKDASAKPVLDVSGYSAPNTFSKIIAHVRSLNPNLKHDDAHQLASTLSRSHTIVG